MQSSTTTLRDTPGVISELELRRLLIDIKEKRPDICVRYRLLGEMWAQQFMRILQVTEKGVMLNDESSNRLIIVTNLANIMQFELDNRFQNFQPFFHYEIIPNQE